MLCQPNNLELNEKFKFLERRILADKTLTVELTKAKADTQAAYRELQLLNVQLEKAIERASRSFKRSTYANASQRCGKSIPVFFNRYMAASI
jgi:hypothetical protein